MLIMIFGMKIFSKINCHMGKIGLYNKNNIHAKPIFGAISRKNISILGVRLDIFILNPIFANLFKTYYVILI